MFKIIGIVAVVYIMFATGLAQIVLAGAANLLLIGASL